jgi:dihydropteroate synthase
MKPNNLDLSNPVIMGILNITPDSFYDGGKYFNDKTFAINRVKDMIKKGASIIDIGGESSRPFATPVKEEEEIKRVIPIIKLLKDKIDDIFISVDTVKPIVARKALESGADMINDISGFENPEMIDIAKSFDCYICCMHMQKSPKNMQINPYYKKPIIEYLLNWFKKRTEKLISKGIRKDKIIIDPGIGFGKNVDHNIEIISNLQKFKKLGFKVLIGASRKSFLSKILDKPKEKLLLATTISHMIALLNGAHIIRVHDIEEHKDMIKILKEFQK